MSQDIVRVLRIIEYVGPRDWVERVLSNSLHGRKDFRASVNETSPRYIQAVTLTAYPEILTGTLSAEERSSA